MPRYGFSGEGPDMRKLIVFALRAVGEAVGERELVRLALIDDNADYFIFADALTALLENGLLAREGDALRLTPRGDEIAELTGRELPAALRRAVSEEGALVREKQMRERCLTAELVTEEGLPYFKGVLTDNQAPLLEIKLQTGSPKQAAALKKRFEKDAETILQRVWDAFTQP